MKIIYLTIVSFLFISPIIHAQTIVTDRPDQTESATVIDPGSFQIESGILFERTPLIENITIPTNLFRVGITNFIELRVVHEMGIMDREALNQGTSRGFNDLQAGFKFQIFRKENSSSQVAFISHLVFPSGTTFFSNGEDYGVINKLAVSHDISDAWAVGYNLGYDYIGEGFFTYALAVGYGITEKVGLYFEPFGAINEDGDHESNLDAGFTYLIRDNIQFDFSFGTGINVDMNYLSIGMSWQLFRQDNE